MRRRLPLQWRHNWHDSVSNHQPRDCLLNRLFRRRSKKTSKPRVTGLWGGNSPGTGEFAAQMASYAENVSIWWCHHDPQDNTHRMTSTAWQPQGDTHRMTLTHPPWTKWPPFWQTTFWNAFSWMKSFVFLLKFHWILFLMVQLIITQHWFR